MSNEDGAGGRELAGLADHRPASRVSSSRDGTVAPYRERFLDRMFGHTLLDIDAGIRDRFAIARDDGDAS